MEEHHVQGVVQCERQYKEMVSQGPWQGLVIPRGEEGKKKKSLQRVPKVEGLRKWQAKRRPKTQCVKSPREVEKRVSSVVRTIGCPWLLDLIRSHLNDGMTMVLSIRNLKVIVKKRILKQRGKEVARCFINVMIMMVEVKPKEDKGQSMECLEMNEPKRSVGSSWMKKVQSSQSMEVQIQGDQSRGALSCMGKAKPKVKMKRDGSSSMLEEDHQSVDIQDNVADLISSEA